MMVEITLYQDSKARMTRKTNSKGYFDYKVYRSGKLVYEGQSFSRAQKFFFNE